MPLINRVRLHNIRYGKERRVMDNLIFDLRGRSSLLILENGGGKTLILQLISQVVCPNASLGKRRLATLVQNNPFTGHVLVEWRLDADTPAYLLTGFCFAENTGSANRDMDYFNYLSAREYNGSHPWDLESLPLVDEDGRTLNYRELQERLRRSGQFRVYGSDRRREYQRELQTYNINPGEWERVLETNSDEGGVGNFFEYCSKTRSLLEKLLLPAIDSILGRGKSSDQDDLALSFQQASAELMHLPEFQAHMHSLNKLGDRIGVMQEALSGVDGAAGEVDAALAGRQFLFNTLVRGIPRLKNEQRELNEQLRENQNRVKKIQYLLESAKCEALRRSLETLQNGLKDKEREREAACRHLEEVEGRYNRLRAWEFCERWLGKNDLLKEEEATKQKLLQGHESVAKEIDTLRLRLWPLLCTLRRAQRAQITAEERQLDALEQDKKKVVAAKSELEKKKQSSLIRQAELKVKSEEFVKRRAELANSFQEVGIETDLLSPEKADYLLSDKLWRAKRNSEEWAAAIQNLSSQLDECSTQINTLSGQEGELKKGLEDLTGARERWQQEIDFLRELLSLAGLEWLFPPENLAALQGELESRRQQSQQFLEDLGLEMNRLQERQSLLSGDAGAVPNNDILLLQETLRKQGVDTITGALFLRNLPGNEERERLVRRWPWLPYALIAEQGQLQRIMRRSPELKIDLSAPVPVAARSNLELLPEEQTNELLCFFHNQGMEPFILPERLDDILCQIQEQQEQLAERREDEQGRNKQIRDAHSVLGNLMTNYECHTIEEWEQRIKEAENTLQVVREALDAAKNQKQCLNEQLEDARTNKGKVEQHLIELSSFEKRLEKYSSEFQEEDARRAELIKLQQSLTAIKVELAACETRKDKIDKKIQDLQDQNKATRNKLEGLEQDNQELYPSTWDHPEDLISQEVLWDDYWGTAENLRARIDALNRDVASFEDVERRIRGYKDDLEKLHGDIQEMGLDFEDVKNSYRPVSKQELDACRREVKAQKDAFQTADTDFRKAEVLTEREKGAWENECSSVVERHQFEPANLRGVDLDDYSRKLRAEREAAAGRIAEQDNKLKLLEQLQQEYQDQVDLLKADNLELTDDPGWEPERELKELACDARAPRRAVRKEKQAVNEAFQRLDECQMVWHQVVDSCQQELEVLNNLDINHLFRQLKARTMIKGWEKGVLSVQESLCHVGRVLSKSQEELERRLKDLDRIKEEVVERAYRHVENILEELKTLQRMSRVELRGSSIPLMEIDLRWPGADAGKELVRSYLDDVIADAVRRREEGESEDHLQQYLQGAVRSAALLEQLVPLDGIKLTVLKPRSDEQPYQSSDYDRWENLTSWSGAQKYIGRFAVFVALMAYLRGQSNKGQKTSVIIADNPFGEASSGHILEILKALTQQAGIQLFCVTAHRQTGIMKDFPVIYSLVARPTLSGQQRMVMNPEKMPVPGTMEAARGLIDDAENSSWKMDIDGQLKLF
jgi:DNA repair exonuclease SbcCD ATPase subunit